MATNTYSAPLSQVKRGTQIGRYQIDAPLPVAKTILGDKGQAEVVWCYRAKRDISEKSGHTVYITGDGKYRIVGTDQPGIGKLEEVKANGNDSGMSGVVLVFPDANLDQIKRILCENKALMKLLEDCGTRGRGGGIDDSWMK